ncbi:hypothetical protein EC912_11327 [Luteibacter rhizovicinus]|uniref:Uncharacterized protein n=1 Tax=Luteibacter rhizovicinus TaxID=242606 RepID=A0A4R3YF66_9GAMM|nr:hypothetical protein [Luteibacter rhizovicinus]TCV91175.1 hypothetical protein EC912_11327 [Luteibacter rhizovicinus]
MKQIKVLAALIAITALASVPALALAKGHSGGSSRVHYSGAHHSESHGGRYSSGSGSSHRGGSYRNTHTSNHYGKHGR